MINVPDRRAMSWLLIGNRCHLVRAVPPKREGPHGYATLCGYTGQTAPSQTWGHLNFGPGAVTIADKPELVCATCWRRLVDGVRVWERESWSLLQGSGVTLVYPPRNYPCDAWSIDEGRLP
jgi:hypothetical protein